MGALRSLLVFLWMAVTVIPAASLIIVFTPFSSPDFRWWHIARPWLRGAVEAARKIGGIQYVVEGEEYLPSAGDNQRIILCPKHQSTWETFFFASRMPHPLAYVFKRELLFIPFFGWAMACLNMIHIDRSARGDAWSKVALLGEQLMDAGKWVIMFPEGTRSRRGEQGVYKTGAARLAVATGASIVPIAVASARCWPRKSFTFIPGSVTVSLGPPIVSGVGKVRESSCSGWSSGLKRRCVVSTQRLTLRRIDGSRRRNRMPNSSERWRLRLMPLGLRKGTFPRTCVNFDLGQFERLPDSGICGTVDTSN